MLLIRRTATCLLGGLLLFGAAGARLPGGNTAKAEALYHNTQYAPALALLDQHSTDAAELNLVGRIYFMQGNYKEATDFLTKALDADSKNSRYADWLGRAWGRRAESGGLSTVSYASKARGYFEQSVDLDPKNEEALSDVFEFYLQAPGIMGGGIDKAEKVAGQIAVIDPADGYAKRARIAEKKKDYPSAEHSFRLAVETAPKQVGHQLELAQFLARQGRAQESDAQFEKAEHDFPNVPRVWFAYASVLVHQNRNLDQAKQLLHKYLEASLTADDPSRSEAEKLLAKASSTA